MPQRSRFQAPRVVSDFPTVQRALREVQEALDAISRSRAMLKVYTSDFSLVAGGFHRVSAPTGRTVNARLPAATGANLSEPVALHLEGMQGAVRVWAAPGQTVNGEETATFSVDGVVALWSNGVNAWTGVAQLPAESPGGAALDAEYLLGGAHGSLPNGRLATASAEISPDVSSPGAISWLLNTASVGFSKLANLTGLSVLGRAANSSGVMAAITANAARQALRVNDAGTALEWGGPVEVRDSGADQGDVYALDFVAGTNVNLAATVAGAVATITPSVDLSSVTYTAGDGIDLVANAFSADVSDFAGTGLEDDGSNNLRIAAAAAGAGLTGGGGSALAVGAGTGITVNANDVAWAGLSVQNNNSALGAFVGIDCTNTTSIIATSASNITEATIRFERAALTGAITASQNDNATLFAGNRVNDAALANREFMDFASGTSVTVTANDAFAGVAGTTCRYTFNVNLSPNYAWTGIHSFTNGTAGVGFFVQMTSGQASFDTALFSVDASSNIDLDAGNVLELAGGASIDLSAPFVLITGPGPDGFLVFDAATASTPSLTANRGMFWVNDPGAPATLPMFTDDANVDHQLAYVDTTTRILEIRYNQAADAAISESVPSGCTWFEVEGVGGGGGGGGADAEAVKESCAGGGGGAGAWFRHRFTVTSGTITGAIGTAGTAGTNTGGSGGAGGTTTVTYDSVSITGPGGSGGTGVSAGPNGNSQLFFAYGGNPGAADTNATERASGGAGHNAIVFSVSANPNAASGGNGGASYYGGGGLAGQVGADSAPANAQDGGAPGSGGGGGARTSTGAASTGATGGAGAPGCMKITFYSGTRPTEATIN